MGICAASKESAPEGPDFHQKREEEGGGGCTHLEQLSRGKKGCESKGRSGNEGFLKFPLHPGKRKKRFRGPEVLPRGDTWLLDVKCEKLTM